MPTAEESGALLGVACELCTNSLSKRPFCGGRCVLTMIAGAVVAGAVVRWDREAKLGILERGYKTLERERERYNKEMRGMRIHNGERKREGKFGTGSWY